MYTVYILFSEKLNKFYTGYTSDLILRMEFHKLRIPGKFTAATDDWKLFYTIECTTKHQALSIEKHIKKMKSSTYIKNLPKYSEISQKLLLRYKN